MRAVDALLRDAHLNHGIPALQAVVMCDGEVVHDSAHGAIDDVPITPTTRFDVASLTKLVATTAVIAVLRSERLFDFDDAVSTALPAFARNGKAHITVRQLLAHASGLPAWRPFFNDALADSVGRAIYPWSEQAGTIPRAVAFDRARQLVLSAVLHHPASETPVRVYSDLGFIALGEWVSAVTRAPLDVVCAERVFAPVGASRTGFIDLHSAPFSAEPIVPTGSTRPRPPAPGQEDDFIVPEQRPNADPGCVDDDNAYALAGVSGHAGVFSTARDVARIGQTLLEDFHGAGRLADQRVVREMFAADTSVSGAARGLGVDHITPGGSTAGRWFGQSGPHGGVGHLGFTGCSMWIDLDRRAVAVLLTNRVLPGREHTTGIRKLRPQFHDVVAGILDGDEQAFDVTDPGASP